MATTFRSVASNAAGASTTVVIANPAGMVDGDVLQACIAWTGGGITMTPPAGWTLVPDSFTVSGALNGSMYTKVAAGEPASWTWTASLATNITGAVHALTGGDQSTPAGATLGAAYGQGAAIAAPSVMAALGHQMLVAMFVTSVSPTTYTVDTPMIERADLNATGITMATATEFFDPEGPTGVRYATAASGAGLSNLAVLMTLSVDRRVVVQYATLSLEDAPTGVLVFA